MEDFKSDQDCEQCRVLQSANEILRQQRDDKQAALRRFFVEKCIDVGLRNPCRCAKECVEYVMYGTLPGQSD
ncbi:hypothetical protein FHX57_001999 [Paraburkholderia tropica]|uniref:hypothetical protein n=1 Tax=Paraburkholderia tropica TaxID=92647 RepID=UPI001614BB2F|nr:hypothetical protein [Paraburkholderia tropica]MBB2999668.1 hypothetical protein [Paraburkholderia tropica]